MTALPEMTPEQRQAGLARAAEVRAARAAAKRNLKAGTLTLADVLAAVAADPQHPMAKVRVSAVVRSMPGFGEVKAAALMERIGIAPVRKVGGLTGRQRDALLAELEPVPA